MDWTDIHEENKRRAERYQDLSRSAFAIGIIALSLVAGFALVMLMPANG